jgi:Uma2 family endonuclease
MSQTTNSIRWTNRDLEVLPKSEGTRYEIIDGELFVTRSPHRKHQQIIGKIDTALDHWSQNSGLGIAIPSPGIIPSDTDSVIPDVVWVSNERLAKIEDEAGHLTAFPELVIEVLSPWETNIRRDREAKVKLYSVQGIQEYWMVDRFQKQFEVYRQQEEQLVLAITLRETDDLTSPLLPDFSHAVQPLLAV